MIKIPVVDTCPHTVTGQGVVHISHPVLQTLAGAIYDKQEWIAFLLGTRSHNGLEITVTDLKIPLQIRSYANCALVRQEPLEKEVVGVVHSHHSMNAFFSTTDDDTLNPRFPFSLVVAYNTNKSSRIERLLGFNYKAEGRAPLPCGTIGVIPFTVSPFPMIPEWPETVTPQFHAPNEAISLSQCPLITRTRTGFMETCTTACQLTSTQEAHAIFGRDSSAFLVEVVKQTRGTGGQKHHNNQRNNWMPGTYKNKGQGWPPHDPEDYDDKFLRHWGAIDY